MQSAAWLHQLPRPVRGPERPRLPALQGLSAREDRGEGRSDAARRAARGPRLQVTTARRGRYRGGTMRRALAALLLAAAPALALPPHEAASAARDWRTKHEKEIVAELSALVAIPNLASDKT